MLVDMPPMEHKACKNILGILEPLQTWREVVLRREADVPRDLLRAQFGNVTEPM
jgi:hypothetical protein